MGPDRRQARTAEGADVRARRRVASLCRLLFRLRRPRRAAAGIREYREDQAGGFRPGVRHRRNVPLLVAQADRAKNPALKITETDRVEVSELVSEGPTRIDKQPGTLTGGALETWTC